MQVDTESSMAGTDDIGELERGRDGLLHELAWATPGPSRFAPIAAGLPRGKPARSSTSMAYGRMFQAAASSPKSVPNARSAKRSARTTSGAADDPRWI